MPLVWRVNTIELPITASILYRLPPHSGTPRQPPLFSVPKVTVVKRFDFLWSLFVHVFVGNGATWLGSHSTQWASSAFSARRHNTRQDHGRQPVLGRRENGHNYMQVLKYCPNSLLKKGFLSLRRSQNRYSSFSLEMENLALDIYFDHDPSHTQTLHFEPPLSGHLY